MATDEVNLASQIQDLTKEELDFLVATCNHGRKYFPQFAHYPEIHRGNLPFIALKNIIFILEHCWVADDDETWRRMRQLHIALINKWKLNPTDYVLDEYTGPDKCPKI